MAGRARILTVLAVAPLALAALNAPAVHADDSGRQDGVLRLTTQIPGQPVGLVTDVSFHDSAVWPRPNSVKRIDVTLPEGFVVDLSAVPACTASDLDLYLGGPDICADSKIGFATASVDFGFDGSEALGGPYHVILLGPGELINYEYNQALVGEPAPDKPGLPLVQRNDLHERGFSLNIPELPTPAPPDFMWALNSAHLEFSDSGVFRTASTCPGGGWVASASFEYFDGTIETETFTVPCRAADQAGQTVDQPAAGQPKGGGKSLPDAPVPTPVVASAPVTG